MDRIIDTARCFMQEEHRDRRKIDWGRVLQEAKRRDELVTKAALADEKRAEAEAEARERAAKYERERVTLGEYYPAFAPGCWKTKIASDWYDEDRWEKVEENYSADRRLTGQFLWNRGLVNDEHYGAGRFSSLFKSPEEQEVTFAEANRAAKIYKRRRFSGG